MAEQEAWAQRWRELSEQVLSEMQTWRAAHPRATLAEIEAEAEARVVRLRARLVEDTALASVARDWTASAAGERPACPTCGQPLQARGMDTRRLTGPGDQPIELTRRYGTCPACGTGLFPLDEELALGGGTWSPAVEQAVIRLGTWLPFERVPRELAALVGVTLGRETVRRRTEAAGAALVAAEQAAVERLARTWPAPDRVEAGWYQVSVDGAMVPLVHGQWAEVKTLAVGLLERQPQADGTWRVRATALSYFSRLADAEAFRRLAWVETHRRGLTLAPRVCAVVDGAEWCQHFIDWHGPDAVRILDFPHAAEYVAAAGRSVFGAESPSLVAWLDQHLHELKHGEPDAVLAALRALPPVTVAGPEGPRCPRDEALGYLTKRRAQIAYATFQAAGLPIGSGVVESANKLVVEARLKGSGMHWARANVNPMLALRSAVCSDRWDEAWGAIHAEQQRQAAERRAQRGTTQRAARPAPPAPAPDAPAPEQQRRQVARLSLGGRGTGRPAADHPWRKPFLRRRSAESTPART